MKYKIEVVGPDKQINSQHGPLRVYNLNLEGTGWVEMTQKPDTAAPKVGDELEGTIEDTQYGKRFKKQYQQGGGGGFGGRANDPETRKSIEKQTALARAVDAVGAYYGLVGLSVDEGPGKHSEGVKAYAQSIINVALAFETKYLCAATPQQPAPKPEFDAASAVDAAMGNDPGQSVNIDDTPF